jgi:hypothetical protein
LVNGALVEYSLRGDELRRQSKEDLRAVGLTGVTSLAWMKSRKLLLGTRQGNLLAVLNTYPPEVEANLAPLVRQVDALSRGLSLSESRAYARDDGSIMEPPGPEAEEDAVRLANRVRLESLASIGGDLLPPNSLGAITYDSIKDRVIFASSAVSDLIWSSVDGRGGFSCVRMRGVTKHTACLHGVGAYPCHASDILMAAWLLFQRRGRRCRVRRRRG